MRYRITAYADTHCTRRARLVAAVICVAAILAVSACGNSRESTHYSFAVPEYASLNEVERIADIAVLGTVTGEQFIVEDDGGNARLEENSVMEQVVSIVDVSEYLKGEGPLKIQVIQPAADSEQSTALAPGDKVVLWLSEETSLSAPSVVEQVGRTWSPIGLDQGVADVVGQQVVPRASSLSAIDLEALGVNAG